MASEAGRRPIIIDCDPGHDDALAILLASRHFDILGITTVAGNVDVERTTLNARRVVDLTGQAIPVMRGCAHPLVRPARDASAVHGASGLDGYEFPAPRTPLDPRGAVDFIISTVRARDDVTVIPTGPLTNVAVALRTAPDIAGRLHAISLMGGSVTVGNVTPAAEFNVWFDPEAADIVLNSGVPIWMCGLNLTHQARIDEATVEAIARIDTHAARVTASLLRFLVDNMRRRFNVTVSMHDPCAVAALLEPAIMTWAPMHVRVELQGEHTRGMTVCDARHVPAFNPSVIQREPAGAQPNAQVAVSLDRDRLIGLLQDALRSLP
jgi:pyrimidine-specific ribonucleoside hydrolase